MPEGQSGTGGIVFPRFVHAETGEEIKPDEQDRDNERTDTETQEER